jgi:hypothetical protein
MVRIEQGRIRSLIILYAPPIARLPSRFLTEQEWVEKHVKD